MASPITTGGFQIQAQPGINYLPASAFSSGAANVLPNISQGMAFASQLQQIQDEAQARPIRQQLQQIALKEAQAKLANLPVDQQLQQIRLMEAQKNASLPGIIPGDITIEDKTQVYPTEITDPSGSRAGPEETVVGDLIKIQNENLVGPGGVITPRQVRTTLKTAEQRKAETAKQAAAIRATDALAAQRGTPKAFEYDVLVQRRDQALQEGDEEAAALYDARLKRMSTLPSLIPAGTTYNRRIEQLAADAGITLDRAIELSKTAEGADALAQAAVANKAAARSPLGAAPLSSAQKQLIRPPVQAVAEQIVAQPIPAEIPQLTPVPVKSKAERDALPPGTPYIGPDGNTYIKK